MKTILCLIMIVACFVMLSAADISYDIGTFRHTDVLDYKLDISNANSSTYNFNQKDISSLFLRSTLSLGGYLNMEKPGYLLSLSSHDNISSSSAFAHYQTEEGTSDPRSWTPSWSTDKRIGYSRYINSFFFRGNLGTYNTLTNNYENQNNDDTVVKSTEKIWSSSNDILVSIGYGRLYDCSDAYIAWCFLRDLDKHGYLKKPYSISDIDELALTMYNLRSLHEFDFHKLFRKKSSILIDFLKSRDYIADNAETEANSTLMDLRASNWFGGRTTGFIAELTPNYTVSSSRRTRYVESDNQSYRYVTRDYSTGQGVDFIIRYERPLHNIFQFNNNVSASHNWLNSFTDYSKNITIKSKYIPYTLLNAKSSLVCYPDYRSQLSLNLSSYLTYNVVNASLIDMSYQTSDIEKSDKYNYFGMYSSGAQESQTLLTVVCRYFLTENTQVNANASGEYYYKKVKGESLNQRRSISFGFGIARQLY